MDLSVHEPVESDAPQIEAGVEMPYETVHGAILDGWRVVSFPAQRADVDPEAVGVYGVRVHSGSVSGCR